MSYYPDLADWACNHKRRDAGEPFKTYHRCDESPDNPLRQAQKCEHCLAVRVVLARKATA